MPLFFWFNFGLKAGRRTKPVCVLNLILRGRGNFLYNLSSSAEAEEAWSAVVVSAWGGHPRCLGSSLFRLSIVRLYYQNNPVSAHNDLTRIA